MLKRDLRSFNLRLRKLERWQSRVSTLMPLEKDRYTTHWPPVLTTLTPLREHQYDLRAALMSDGIPGRDHTFDYLRGYDGKWYKSLAATVPELRPLLWTVEGSR